MATQTTALEKVKLDAKSITLPDSVEDSLQKLNIKRAASVAVNFLDVSSTATGRATHYNSKTEQEAAMNLVHKTLFNLDRGLYSILACLDGVLDISKQITSFNLMSNPRNTDLTMTTDVQEAKILAYLMENMPPQRMLKFYKKVSEERVNNARTRKLILRTLLYQDFNKLDRWSVTYRNKLRIALTHALGKRMASIVCSIIPKRTKNRKEKSILQKNVVRFIEEKETTASNTKKKLEAIAFILGEESMTFSLPQIKAFIEVKKGKWNSGKLLSEEVLEGLRATYHTTRTHAEVLEMTKQNLTEGKKIAIQRVAEKNNVTIKFDPKKQEPVKLYVYAFQRGMTKAIEKALKEKAEKIANSFPVALGNIGVIVDNSASMYGHGSQKNRPMAIALSVRDVLVAGASDSSVVFTDTPNRKTTKVMKKASGDTSLARPLIKLLKEEKDAIFVLSDGYENAPAGRFSEVLKVARDIGIDTPVFQITPVASAENIGVKDLAPGLAHTLPVASGNAITSSMLKVVLQYNPEEGLRALIGSGLKSLGYTSESQE